jgi:hypothetical protein
VLREIFDAVFRPEPGTEPPVVVLSDLDDARAALRRALEGADEFLQPGLRRAAALLDDLRPSRDDLVLAWAGRVLRDAGVDPRTDEVGAIRRLREAVPGRMPLVPAAALVRRLRDAGPASVQ